MANQKLDWIASGAIHDLIAHRKAGKSINTFLRVLHDKYNVSLTAGRVSQVLKSLRDKEALNLKEPNIGN